MTAGLVATTSPAQASAHRPDPVEQGVYVVGDSITWRVAHQLMTPGQRPRGWTLEGFPGRRVTSLTEPFIAPTSDYWPAVEHMFTMTPRKRVSTVVIALGTNGADEDLTVEQAEEIYRDGVAKVREQDIWRTGPKRVILVTPYRIPRIERGALNPGTGVDYEPYQWASKMGVYAAAMRGVAATTSDVCIMPWRAAVSKRPHLLVDGIHPTRRGERLWRTLLFRSIRNCGK